MSLAQYFRSTNVFRFLKYGIKDSWGYVRLGDYLDLPRLILLWRTLPYSQQNYASLSNVYDLTHRLESENIPGAVVECGVCLGGCAAVMTSIVQHSNTPRNVWLFDSFAGMPEATVEDVGESASILASGRMTGNLIAVGTNIATLDEVKDVFFKKLRLKNERIHFVKGWFQETLPVTKVAIGQIGLLRVDGDWYASTKVCLEELYDNVVSGGYVVVDDYGYFPGCKKAVDEFFQSRGLHVTLHKVDYSRVYFRKP
ncbi:MAG: TylF/MycF/NovP-related O-methyltransferase [bacterium]